MTCKRILSLTALLLALITLASCSPIVEEQPKPSPTPMPEIEVSMPENTGSIQAGTVHTVGLSLSGMLYVAGHSTHGQLDARNTGDVAQVVSSKNTIAALKTDGTIALFGETDTFSDALGWKDIVKLAMSDEHLVGLTNRGFLKACGSNSRGQCEVQDFCRVIDIDAAKGYTAALTDEGTIITTANAPVFVVKSAEETEEPEETKDTEETKEPSSIKTYTLPDTNIVSIAAAETFTAALTSSGKLILTGDAPEQNWSGAEHIYSAGDYVYAQAEGSFRIYPETDALSDFENTSDLIHVAFGDDHTAVMHKDGTVECIGTNDDKQCDTENWDLLTHVENGYVTGFAPNTDAMLATRVMSDELSGTVIFRDNGQPVTSGVVKTGMTVSLDGEDLGTVIIYGDIDCDGDITENDLNMLKAHIDGTSELSGVELLASDILHYPGETDRINSRHVKAYEAYLSGTGSIAQYVLNPYRAKLAEKYRINDDVVGWIELHDTNIDYPIVYGDDYYYHERNIYKEHSNGGCIYPLYHDLFKVNAVAGHNMRVSGTMFHELHSIQNNKEALLTYKNRVYGIQFYEGYSEWEVFALYETPAEESIETMRFNMDRQIDATDEQVQKWIDTQVNRSEIDLDVKVTPEDTFLFLYTCGDYYEYDRDNQARLYIFMRKVG